jgi:hypothetical protein
MTKFITTSVLLSCFAAVLAGCGGNSADALADLKTPESIIVSGVAATGAPMSGAAILMLDARGSQVCDVTALTDGSYSCELALTVQSPLVVSASKNGVVHYAPVVELKTGTTNVTQLTTLIAAQLSPTGVPSALAAQIKDDNSLITSAKVTQVVQDLRTALRPLLTKVAVDIDPLNGVFKADGSGHDQVLLSLDVLIKPTETQSNIIVTLKTEVTPNVELPAITWVSGNKPPAFAANVANAKLPTTDEDRLVLDFVKRMNDCYALAKSTRVGVDGLRVVAPACLSLFPGQNQDNFKHDGARVGPNGAFAGLFADTSTGATFEAAEVEFRYPGDQMRLLINVVSSSGVRSFTRIRLQRQNDKLVALGNQYNYRFLVRPWTEQRNLVNRPELSYRSTGFNIHVDNVQNNGNPIFQKVVVTSAAQSTAFSAELRPNVSLSYLSIFLNNQLTPTNNLRLSGKFMDPTTSGRPNRLSPSSPGSLFSELLVWFAHPETDMDWDDSQLDAIPELTSWKAVFYLANGDVETQYYETRTAPSTMPELNATRWAQLSTDTMGNFIQQTRAGGSYALTGLTQYDVKWTVPEGAQAPTEIQTQGYWRNGQASLRFNDVQPVSAGAVSGSVKCSAQGDADGHCNGTGYAGATFLDGLPLFAFSRREVFLASQNFGYLLNGHVK